MVSCYLCDELSVPGPTARTAVDKWEHSQQRPPGWSGAGAHGTYRGGCRSRLSSAQRRGGCGDLIAICSSLTGLQRRWSQSPQSCPEERQHCNWIQGNILHHEVVKQLCRNQTGVSYFSDIQATTDQGRSWASWADFDPALSRGQARELQRTFSTWMILCVQYLNKCFLLWVIFVNEGT